MVWFHAVIYYSLTKGKAMEEKKRTDRNVYITPREEEQTGMTGSRLADPTLPGRRV